MENKLLQKNLLLRTVTSLILAPLVLFTVHKGGIVFTGIILIASILMAFEWVQLTIHHDKKKNSWWKMIGVLYISAPCIALLYISGHPQGKVIITWILVTVWAADMSAFFVGKLVGGPKLAPSISPNKTWSGFLSTILVAYLIGLKAPMFIATHNPKALLALTITIAVYAQIGDLIESWIKRKFGAKDSGKLLPGHGGILDRVDGIIITAPKIALVITFPYYQVFA